MQRIPDPAAGSSPDPSAISGSYRRGSALAFLALLAVMTGGAGAVVFGLDARDLLAALRTHHHWLLGFVAGTPVLASLLFMAVYAMAVVISLPGLALLTLIGGYLFGWLEGTAYVLLAATLAATAVFMLARSAIGEPLRARAGPSLLRFADGFRNHALSYVFVLHLVPIFPYAVVIGIPAACGVRVRTFVISAFLGLLPGTLLFAHLGSGLGKLLASGLPLSPSSLMRPGIVLPLAGLGLLAVLPIAYQAWRARRAA